MSEPKKKPPLGSTYDVGYAKPPADSRYRPGQSGNPRGRKRGSRNNARDPVGQGVFEVAHREASRLVTISENGETKTITVLEGGLRKAGIRALQGHNPSLRTLTHLKTLHDRSVEAHRERYLQTMIEYKLNRQRELERCRALGFEPEMLPHPELIEVDIQANEVRVHGPWTPEEKEIWDRKLDDHDRLRARIAAGTKLLDDPQLQPFILKKLKAFRRAEAKTEEETRRYRKFVRRD